MNLASFVELSAAESFRTLGQAGAPRQLSPAEAQAWEAYFRAIRNTTVQKWNNARAAYLALQKVRGDLGLPLTGQPGEGGAAVGALLPETEAQAVQLGTMITVATGFIDDVLANKRRVGYPNDQVGLVIESLPTDQRRIVYANDRPVLVDAAGNPIVVVGTTVESIGMLSFGWAGAVAVAAVALSAYFIFQSASDNLAAISRSATAATVSKHWAQLVREQKVTPEQAQKGIKAVYDGQAAATNAEAQLAAEKAKPTSDISGAVKTLGIVALVLGGIYLAAQLLPAVARRPAQGVA